jgi:hypothetical protein
MFRRLSDVWLLIKALLAPALLVVVLVRVGAATDDSAWKEF